jgi:predicted transcriptional regulator
MAKSEPDIFEQSDEIDPEFDARRLAEAEADIAAGRTVSNDEVIEWLETWGKPDEKAAPTRGSSKVDAGHRR